MAIESSANTINDLDQNLPSAEDFVSEGDDHLRTIKRCLLNTFPNVEAVMTASDIQLNNLAKALENTASDTTLTLYGGNVVLGKDKPISTVQEIPEDVTKIERGSVLNYGMLQDLFYPIGCIKEYTIETNPNQLLGFGTWIPFGAGRVLVGSGKVTDINAIEQTFAAGATGGELTHLMTVDELAKHGHTGETAKAGNHKHALEGQACYYTGRNDDGQGGDPNAMVTGEKETLEGGEHTHDVTVGDTGSSKPMNVMQPYVVVYRWTRTA